MADQQENSNHAAAVGWGLLFIVFAALAWMIWFYFDDQIRDVIRWIRYGEMWVVKILVDIAEFMGLIEDGSYTITYMGRELSWDQGFKAVPEFNKYTMDSRHMGYITALSMQPLKYPLAALMFGGAIWVIFKGPKTYYRQKLGLEELIRRQALTFPTIAPLIEFDPRAQPPRAPGSPVPAELPAFAEALSPEEWVAYHRIPVPDGKLDEKKALAKFRKQLGARWRGWKALSPDKQVLLAAFTLRAIRQRDASDAMLGQLALCWSHKKGLRISRALLGQARKILNDKSKSEGILKCCNQHAFETTAMVRALQYARGEGGILASAQFVWLRAHDRNLWYPLNNLGRESFHMEAVGAMAHYKREKRTQRPIPVPKLEDAIDVLREYLASKKARPIPALDYQDTKKRGIKKAK